jgi:uncharacterized protein YdaU (DUF1376 family)
MKSPAFQFYPRDWLGDPEIMLMDWDARGMHLHCMCIAWMHTDACALPNNDSMLMRWLGVTDAQDWQERLKPQIFSAWKLEGDQWVQSRLKREKIKQLEFSEKRKKAADKRWENRAAPHDASALQVQCSSSSSSTAVSKRKKQAKKKADEPDGARKRAPVFEKPTAAMVAWYCTERGNNVDPVAFVDYYESVNWHVGKKRMSDWKAAVRTWEKRNAENQRANNGGHNGRSKAERFFDAIKDYAATGDMGCSAVFEDGGEVRPQVVQFISGRAGKNSDG